MKKYVELSNSDLSGYDTDLTIFFGVNILILILKILKASWIISKKTSLK